MGSSTNDSDCIDDSGFVQDESLSNKMQLHDSEYKGSVELLDLSDHVLLFILKYCSVRDLKALGFSCSRLAALILDRTLWQRADASTVPVGLQRMRWMCAHGLCADTTHLSIRGFANEKNPCVGQVEGQATADNLPGTSKASGGGPVPRGKKYRCTCGETDSNEADNFPDVNNTISDTISHCNMLIETGAILSTNWLNAMTESNINTCYECGFRRFCSGSPHGWCPGPKYTLEPALLSQMQLACPKLHTLKLEYCNIDCRRTGLNHFPPTLKRLSLVGTKCYHQSFDNKSFLFKVQDYLTELEELDLSLCEWMEPSSMLPLSKMPSLRRLYLRRCPKMTEFVAYASLATRYGFNKLEVIDLRESPVGDSEVSSFGWLASLLELYACPPPKVMVKSKEVPYAEDELDPWEKEEPDFFKLRLNKSPMDVDDPDGRSPKDRRSNDMPGGSSSKYDDDDDYGPSAKKKRYNNMYEGKVDTPSGKVNFWFSPGGQNPNDTPNNNDDEGNSSGEATSRAEPNIIVISTRRNRDAREDSGRKVEKEDKSVGTSDLFLVNHGAGTSQSDSDLITDNSTVNDEMPKENSNTAETSTVSNVTDNSENNADLVMSQESSGTSTFNIDAGTSSVGTTDAVGEQSDSASTSLEVHNSAEVSEQNSDTSDISFNTDSDSVSDGVLCTHNCERARRGAVLDLTVTKDAATSGEGANNGDEPRPAHHRRRRERNSLVYIPSNKQVPHGIPRNNILYVNISRRLNRAYRLAIPCDILNSQVHQVSALEASNFVTDAAVYRFGHSDSAPLLNMIHFGVNNIGTRPDRSNLRVLSITGYRTITDRSLIHLTTSAPHLRLLDLSRTRVTRNGVENFMSLRPDCEVIWSEFVDDEKSE